MAVVLKSTTTARPCFVVAEPVQPAGDGHRAGGGFGAQIRRQLPSGKSAASTGRQVGSIVSSVPATVHGGWWVRNQSWAAVGHPQDESALTGELPRRQTAGLGEPVVQLSDKLVLLYPESDTMGQRMRDDALDLVLRRRGASADPLQHRPQ